MNLVEIMGIVGADPEERTTPSGSKVISFRIADNIRKGGGNEETIWWKVTIWGDQFDRMMPYIKKGSALVVHGEIRRKPEIYQDREGNSQVSMEVTATQLRFSPFGRSQNSEEGSSRGGDDYSKPSSAPAASVSMNSPGGFRPAVGTSGSSMDEFSEDNLPF